MRKGCALQRGPEEEGPAGAAQLKGPNSKVENPPSVLYIPAWQSFQPVLCPPIFQTCSRSLRLSESVDVCRPEGGRPTSIGRQEEGTAVELLDPAYIFKKQGFIVYTRL
jgi:hypothetical protein